MSQRPPAQAGPAAAPNQLEPLGRANSSSGLDPFSLPLQGSHLIEASAGTGKTWTIAALYVRLVLEGLRSPESTAEGDQPLLPGEILVMTFTRAATRELVDRIRDRLVKTAQRLRDTLTPPEDEFAAYLVNRFASPEARAVAAWRAARAAEMMDEAAVQTIDAWCQRMLREHAFESGCLFDEELEANEPALRAEAVRDYWRQQVYPLEGEALAAVLGIWDGPEDLGDELGGLIDQQLEPEHGRGELSECLASAQLRRAAALAALKAGWVEREAQMRSWLETQWANARDKPINGRALGPSNGRKWLDSLKRWASDPQAVEFVKLGKGAEKLGLAGLTLALNSGVKRVPPDAFAEFDALMKALSQLEDVSSWLRAHAATRIRQRLAELKARTRTFGFADMLERLDSALDEAHHGERARLLRERIVQRYPAALIDEFQDTSPVQLRVFQRLYRIEENHPARLLVLIGDPKQAIYGFRGADIHSYLRARLATEGRHHVLGTNRRATCKLVAAVNSLFDLAEQRAADGAFLFGGVHGGGNPVPFVPVAPQGRPERFVTSAGEVPAVSLCWDAQPRNKGDHREVLAARAAERILSWLNDPQAWFITDAHRGGMEDYADAATGDTSHVAGGAAGITALTNATNSATTNATSLQSAIGKSRSGPVQPRDIAVLVRTGYEAAVMQRALRERGVASVYQSDKDSVFAREEAGDLLRLLQAAAAPRDVRLARAALATGLVGLSMAELRRLAEDDEAFDAQCELLRQLHVRWRTQGVLAMVRHAVHGLHLPERWLAREGPARMEGERHLTNLLHLAELLQAESARLAGEQALTRWLADQVHEAQAGLDAAGTGGSEERVLRLESDADLVRVVTVHQSKGLQYPIVLLPFAALPTFEEGSRPFLVVPDGEGGRQVSFAPTKEQREAADHERRREEVRLLYVALTRAEHALWLGVVPPPSNQAKSKGGSGGASGRRQTSALWTLLSGSEPRAEDERAKDLQRWVERAAGALQVEEAGLAEGEAFDAFYADLAAAPSLAARISPTSPTTSPTSHIPRTQLQPRQAPPPLLPALRYDAQFDRNWSISSYSALVKGVAGSPGTAAAMLAASAVEGSVLSSASLSGTDGVLDVAGTAWLHDDEPPEGEVSAALGYAGAAPPVPDGASEAQVAPGIPSDGARALWGIEQTLPSAPAASSSAPHAPERPTVTAQSDLPAPHAPDVSPAQATPWHQFPRGAWAGNFLHGQLEWLASEGFALEASPALERALRQRCARQGWGHRAGDVVAWLKLVCTAPLPALGGVPLAGLQRTLPEMEFWLPSDGWRVSVVDELCRAHVLPGRDRPALPERRLQGFLMGFADLTFGHAGRFGVLDYKSNALGTSDAAYTQEAMEAAMLHHRYDVQAALYLLALHRLLRHRMGAAYRPAQHLHGAVYFFLRGVQGSLAGAWHLPPPVVLLEALDAMVASRAPAQEAAAVAEPGA